MTAITVTTANATESNIVPGPLTPEEIQFVEKFWEAESLVNPALATLSEEEYFAHFEELCSRCCSPDELGLDCNELDLMCRSQQCSHLKPLSDKEVGELLDSLEKSLKDGTLKFDTVSSDLEITL